MNTVIFMHNPISRGKYVYERKRAGLNMTNTYIGNVGERKWTREEGTLFKRSPSLSIFMFFA
jgi:hypothetical protein